MRATNIPNAGAISNGLRIRQELAKALSYMEIRVSKLSVGGTAPASLTSLRAQLQFCVDHLDALEASLVAPEA